MRDLQMEGDCQKVRERMRSEIRISYERSTDGRRLP